MTHFDPRAVFHAMCEASREHRMPERFRTDLTKHDRAFLRQHDGSPFGWILYEHGTHVLQHDDTRKPSKRGMARKVAENFGAGTTYPAARFYAWDGAAFREVSKDEWIEILTEPGAWFVVDTRDLVAQRVTESAPENRPRFVKLYALDATGAINYTLWLKQTGRAS